MQRRPGLALPLALAVLLLPGPARADPSATVAALQIGLHARGLYRGPIDGIPGPLTKRAVRVLQRRARIPVDGVAGPKTRHALGRFARHHRLGIRPLHLGLAGWDVAAMQFELAEHGFPSGTFDGIFGPRIKRALRRFQKWAGLHVDGVAGPATLKALRGPPASIPLALAWPLMHARLVVDEGNRVLQIAARIDPVGYSDRIGCSGGKLFSGKSFCTESNDFAARHADCQEGATG